MMSISSRVVLLTGVLTCVACVGAAGIAKPRHSAAERLRLIAPMAEGQLRLRPTFNAVGAAFGAAAEIPGLTFEVRKVGAADWVKARSFPYFAETKDYRGSAMGLEEDTDYEARLIASDGRVAAQGTFRTWSSEVPVAKTVVLEPPADGAYPLKLAAKGTAQGWIRYVAKPGAVFDNPTTSPTLDLTGAEYAIVEGLTLRNGYGPMVVKIAQSRAVRLRNCDIAGWGRRSRPKYDAMGRPCERDKVHLPATLYRADNGGWRTRAKGMVNFDGAIDIGRGASETVIERCYVHDAGVHANSWYYSHPAGGEAIMLRRPDHSTVIRYNDFVGSDLHRFNDAVESEGNFDEDGGINRDADVYGNFMIYCADDNIELDGGQQNVRCFGNRFEAALCGVSIQGCMASPVYVADNVFLSMGDEFGIVGQTIKTGGGAHGHEAHAYLDANLFWGRGSGVTWMELLQVEQVGNTFCGKQGIQSPARSPKSSSKDDKFGVEIAEAALPTVYPKRPLGFLLDRARFSDIKVEKGVAAPSALTVTATSTATEAIPFEVKVNDDMPWLVVAPKKGQIPAGGRQVFTVSFRTELMNDRHDYRGAFLVRTPNGFSRPVSVYAETDFVPPFKPEAPGAIVHYAEVGGEQVVRPGQTFEYAFDLPKDGRYYFMLRLKDDGNRGRLQGAIDEAKPELVKPQAKSHYQWLMFDPGCDFGNRIRFYDLKAGRHVMRFKGVKAGLTLAGALVTTDPGPFEPR